MADYAGTCVTGPTGPVGESATCNLRGPIDNHVADAGCVDNTNGSGLKTVCSDEVVGVGHTYSVVTTKTVTTTPFSGGVPAGASTVVTTPGASSPVNGGQCYATAQTFPDRPPVDVPLCGAWPCTASVPGAPGSYNSLADVAQYYYKTDLRSDFDNKLIPVGSGDEDDSATHQHMTTFVLALGVSGTLKFRPDYRSAATLTGDFAEIRAGTRDWPIWPDAAIDYTNPGNYNNPKSIDDYWHTAVNGRGRFFSANDPNSAAQGLRDALATAGNKVASGSADGTSTLQLSSTDNFLYSTKYESAKWQGDVEARFVNPTSGVPGAVVWSAAKILATKVQDDCDDRSIWVMNGTLLDEFAWHTNKCSGALDVTGLTAGEQALVSGANVALLSQFPYMTDGSGTPPTKTQQQNAQADGALVNFLRGQRGSEGFISNDAKKLFRSRETSLGDIVDSQPVYVREPFASYLDANYGIFKSTNSGREPMIYVGGNDGMLHAFYATLDLTNPLHGQEAWAVIPSAVLPNMYKLADDDYNRGGHQFYVDGTPVVGDIQVAGIWKTILVGGLNAGGKGYYALDVTAAGAKPKALWEFKQNPLVCPATELSARGNTADCNLGLTFGKPIITKLKNTWVVMFTSGYNNLNGAGNGFDGGGFLYVLDAFSGQVMYKIATEVAGLNVGSIGSPSGLAQVNNYVDNVLLDNTTLRAYGGDLLGNIWRFDFPDLPAVGTATLIGRAKDASNNVQPITVRPELAEVDGKPFIMVGTGKFLGGSDVTDLQVQSVYGLRDPLTGPVPLYADPLRSVLRPMKVDQTPPTVPGDFSTAVRTIVCTGSASECDRSQGWVLDLGEPGERVNVEMKLVLGALVFASNVPQDVPCDVGGHSWFNQVDFRFGAPIPGAAVTTQFLSASLNVGFNVVQLEPAAGSNPTYSGIFRQGDAKNVNKPVTPPEPTSPGRRISWREIPQ
jgi:Tfp pilus tip-associated adhesin PilY1